MTARVELVDLCWVFFCQLVTDLSVLKYELSLYSFCLFSPLYGYSKIYLVFFSGDLIEGSVENKPLFFVVTISLRAPKLRAAVMQKMHALDVPVFFIN